MQKHYKSLCLAVIILLAGVLFDFWPLWEKYSGLRAMHHELAQKLVTIKRFTPSPNKKTNNTAIKQEMVIQGILNAVHLSGLRLVAMLPIESDMVKVTLTGTFEQSVNFVRQLTGQALPLLVMDYKNKLSESNQLQINMDIGAIKITNFMPRTDSLMLDQGLLITPFCSAARVTSERANVVPDTVRLVSIKQMKMVGFLQQEDKKQAWILLPDQSMQLLALHNVIGQEKAVVTDIQLESVTLTLPNKSVYVLKKPCGKECE